MARKPGELLPIGEALADLGGPVKAIREATPQALHHFTLADQVNQLVSASEADPDLWASWAARWRCARCPGATPATGFFTSASTDLTGSTCRPGAPRSGSGFTRAPAPHEFSRTWALQNRIAVSI